MLPNQETGKLISVFGENGERQSENKRELAWSQSLVHFSHACNGQDWTGPEPGAGKSVQVSNVGGRNPIT